MKKFSTLALLLCATIANAQIDLTQGGGTSTIYLNQSFNETRAIDITVISPSVTLTSATLKRFNVYVGPGASDSARVGFRLYHTSTRALLASHDTIVYSTVTGGSFTFPISYVLDSGDSYRVSFYIKTYPDTTLRGRGDLLAPVSLTYTEPTNHFKINAYYGQHTDVYPDIAGFIACSFISLGYQGSNSISELTSETAPTIYPNPFVHSTSINISTPNPQVGALSIYNSFGQRVQYLDNFKTNETNTIYRNGLPAGVYFVRFETQSENIYARKIIITD